MLSRVEARPSRVEAPKPVNRHRLLGNHRNNES